MAQVAKVFAASTTRELEQKINAVLADVTGDVVQASFSSDAEGFGALLIIRSEGE